jgi:hypothetical protein
MSGRRRARTAVRGAVAALAIAAGGPVATAAAASEPSTCSGVELSPYEYPPALSAVMTPDPALLNALAREYCQTTAHPSVEDFSMWWVFNRMEDIALGAASPPPGITLDLSRDEDLKRALWVQHVFGTYTANWYWHNGHSGPAYGPTSYNQSIKALGPVIAGADAGYARSIAQMQADMRLANHGTAPDVTAFNLSSVRGDPIVPGTTGAGLYQTMFSPSSGDAVFYGYDLAFLDAVVHTNKPAFAPPHDPYFTYSLAEPFDATYAIGDAPFLAVSRGHAAAVAGGSRGPRAQARMSAAIAGAQPLDQLVPVITLWYGVGYGLWAPGLANSLRDYSEPEYNVVLKAGVYTLQWSQSNALAGLAAYATEDTDLGRRQVRAVALWKAYAWAYLNTLGGSATRLPTFTTSTPKPAKPCTSKARVVIRTAGLRHPRVRVNGRRVRVQHGRAVIDLRSRPGQRVVARTTGRDAAGRVRTRTQIFQTCARGPNASGPS